MTDPERLVRGLWRLELPSRTLPPFTTTNSYLIESAAGAWLVDPGAHGSDMRMPLERALTELGLRSLAGVLLTHGHRDHHDGLAQVLARDPELPVLVHPRECDRLAPRIRTHPLTEGELDLGGRRLRVLSTPGHSPGSLSFVLTDVGAALVGDLLVGRGSSWVGRPDGDVAAYLASLELLAESDPLLLGPGHGPPLDHPQRALRQARDHRLSRERQILERLTTEPLAVPDLREAIYPELDPAVHDPAERSLLAHLDKLVFEGRVVLDERVSPPTARHSAGWSGLVPPTEDLG